MKNLQGLGLPLYGREGVPLRPLFVSRLPRRKVTGAAHLETVKSPAALGEGLLVIRAAEMRDSGISFKDIEACILSERNTMCQYFTVDDLKYLKKGGRISGTAATIGTLLNIKPILKGDETGHIISCGKARGKKAALITLAEKYGALAADKKADIGIAHADAPEDAEALVALLKKQGFRGNVLNVCYEPVTGSHVGPGTVALFFPGTEK